MSAEKFYNVANSLFVDEDYQKALENYSQAIELNKSNSDFYQKRAACHIKLENFTNAIQDSELSLKIDSEQVLPHLRKGISYFSLGEFKSAVKSLETGLTCKKITPEQETVLKRWKRKAECENEEKPKIVKREEPKREAPKQEIKKEEAPIVEEKKLEAPKEEIKKEEPKIEEIKKEEPKLRHNWYQNTAEVIISVLQKNIKKEDLNVQITSNQCHVNVKILNDSLDLILNLFEEIDPEKSKFQLFSTKVEITLVKKKEGVHWNALEKVEVPIPKKLATPYASKKDWDTLEKTAKEIEKEESEKLDGDQALNHLFKKIYGDANDDTRRAMQKSYVESGGTVLSTNWKEVGAKKVEGSAPKGMEMKKK